MEENWVKTCFAHENSEEREFVKRRMEVEVVSNKVPLVLLLLAFLISPEKTRTGVASYRVTRFSSGSLKISQKVSYRLR